MADPGLAWEDRNDISCEIRWPQGRWVCFGGRSEKLGPRSDITFCRAARHFRIHDNRDAVFSPREVRRSFSTRSEMKGVPWLQWRSRVACCEQINHPSNPFSLMPASHAPARGHCCGFVVGS